MPEQPFDNGLDEGQGCREHIAGVQLHFAPFFQREIEEDHQKDGCRGIQYNQASAVDLVERV